MYEQGFVSRGLLIQCWTMFPSKSLQVHSLKVVSILWTGNHDVFKHKLTSIKLFCLVRAQKRNHKCTGSIFLSTFEAVEARTVVCIFALSNVSTCVHTTSHHAHTQNIASTTALWSSPNWCTIRPRASEGWQALLVGCEPGESPRWHMREKGDVPSRTPHK